MIWSCSVMVGFWKEVTLAEGKVMMNSNKSLKISPEHILSLIFNLKLMIEESILNKRKTTFFKKSR